MSFGSHVCRICVNHFEASVACNRESGAVKVPLYRVYGRCVGFMGGFHRAQNYFGASMSQKTPSEFLKGVLGRVVVVKLNSGVTYRGILACLDGYMNIAMEQTQEYVDGQPKNSYSDTFIRGNNGMRYCRLVNYCSTVHQNSEIRSLFIHSNKCSLCMPGTASHNSLPQARSLTQRVK